MLKVEKSRINARRSIYSSKFIKKGIKLGYRLICKRPSGYLH